MKQKTICKQLPVLTFYKYDGLVLQVFKIIFILMSFHLNKLQLVQLIHNNLHVNNN